MPFARTKIDPTYDREWIAQTGGFTTHTQDLDENGEWLYCADDIEAAQELIDNYPSAYLAKRLPEAKEQIEARAQQAFLAGFTVPTGKLAGETLQCRDNEDRSNWLASALRYAGHVQVGDGATEGATFRTASNATITCSYAEGYGAIMALGDWGAEIMARAWALKDAAAAAGDIAALDAVLADLDNGWPVNNG